MADNINNQNAGAATQQATKTKRDLALERLKSRHPDTDYADDEAIYGAINDDYDEDQASIKGYKENEKALSDMMSADPKSAVFLQAMKAGKNPWVELVRNFGEDAIDYFTDPENVDEIAAAQSDYMKNVSDGNKLEEEYNSNLENSLKVFDAFEDEHGEDVTNEIIGEIFVDANNVIRGKFSKEMLEMRLMGKNHDKDVNDAAAEAEVRGKNSKHMEHLKLRQKGDGTANLDSASADGNNGGDNQPNFGAIGRMARKKNIYEAGNEKRTRYR